MIPFKVKVEKTEANKKVKINSRYGAGYVARIQAVFYSSNNPSFFLKLFDADGDQFMFQIPGQGIPRPTTPEIPVTVKLPLQYVDIGTGEHNFTIFGEVYKATGVETNL